jgi:hypothetical protein
MVGLRRRMDWVEHGQRSQISAEVSQTETCLLTLVERIREDYD